MSLLRKTLAPGLGASVPVRPRPVRVPLALVLSAAAARRAARVAWWLVRHPVDALGLAGVVAVGWAFHTFGRAPCLLATGVVALALCLWGLTRPASFDRWVETPLRSRWRRLTTYRRHWQPAMVTTGLARVHGAAEHLPELLRVTATAVVDEVTARMLPGHTTDDWARAGERLAQTFGARSCRAYPVPDRPRLVRLRLPRTDPLATPVVLPAPAGRVDLTAVPVGVREDGRPLTLPVLYSHLLVGGETGAGKGSVIWSLLAGLAPAVRDGLVKLLVVDPKGGLELSAGQPLYTSWSYGGPEESVQLLEDAVEQMRARAKRLRRRRDEHGRPVRKLTPNAGDPLIVIVIDELASLTAYVTDAELRRRLSNALALLLSQGRAVGVAVVAATQDVRKDVVTMRDLFPLRVALRAAEAGQAEMLLGAGARERGAWTDRIPHATPGVGYVMEDGAAEPVRVRFFHVTDGDVAALAAAAREVAA